MENEVKGWRDGWVSKSVICISVRTCVLIPSICITVWLLCIHDPSIPVELQKAEKGDSPDAHGTASLGEPSRETTRKPLFEYGGGWGAAPGVFLSPSHVLWKAHISLSCWNTHVCTHLCTCAHTQTHTHKWVENLPPLGSLQSWSGFPVLFLISLLSSAFFLFSILCCVIIILIYSHTLPTYNSFEDLWVCSFQGLDFLISITSVRSCDLKTR